jgi:hypothetical protein
MTRTASHTEVQSNDNFSVGADLRVRPKKGAHAGAPLQFFSFSTAPRYQALCAHQPGLIQGGLLRKQPGVPRKGQDDFSAPYILYMYIIIIILLIKIKLLSIL